MRERGTRRKWREAGSHLSLLRKPDRLSVRIARHLNAASHRCMLRRLLAPNLRGGDAGQCPWAPSPWLQGREPVRTCCPGAAQGRSTSHHLPSDGRTGTRASAACSPSIRLRAGIPCAGDLMLGAWTRCADAGGGEGQGPFQMNGKSSRKRERPAQEWRGRGVGAMSAARPPMPWEDSGHSGNALAQQAGGLGGDLLAGSRSARRIELSQHRRGSMALLCPITRCQSTPDPELGPQPPWSCPMQDRTLLAKRGLVSCPTQMCLHW